MRCAEVWLVKLTHNACAAIEHDSKDTLEVHSLVLSVVHYVVGLNTTPSIMYWQHIAAPFFRSSPHTHTHHCITHPQVALESVPAPTSIGQSGIHPL